jgi:hypothetical protein
MVRSDSGSGKGPASSSGHENADAGTAGFELDVVAARRRGRALQKWAAECSALASRCELDPLALRPDKPPETVRLI